MPLKLKLSARTVGLVVNAPELFDREDFVAWLDDPENRTATWREKGLPPDEWSDVFVLVDSEREGPESDMPEDVWNAICDLVYAECGEPGAIDRISSALGSHVVVRLTNLAD
jgi:hypothetical protein